MIEVRQFTAVLQKDEGRNARTYFAVPFDVGTEFGLTGCVPVRGSIDGLEFDGLRLMPLENGRHQLHVPAILLRQLRKKAGDAVDILLESVPPPDQLPDDIGQALDNAPLAKAFFEKMTRNQQNYYVEWIGNTWRDSVRRRRIRLMIERLEKGLRFTDK